jgi:formylglycine-generating enzyme required for sulfatase activity
VVRAILGRDCDGEAACQNILLAGACLEDVGETGLGRNASGEVIEALRKASRDRSLPPATQRDAGFCLGRLAGSSAEYLQRIRPDLDEFIPIQAGEFRYGDQKRREIIQEAFSIAKYPVTNLQFRDFVEAKGYDDEKWWSEDGWAWRTGVWDSQATQEYRNWLAGRPAEKRGEPYYWRGTKWDNPLAPVVGVSWFEAEAYCAWYSAQAGRRQVRLPNEMEWERAGRGTQGWEYPWGDKFERSRLNCAEFWGGQDDLNDYKEWEKWFDSDSRKEASTSMVGQFPEGGTPEGICELSGNVWEWTASWYDTQQGYRTLRGGSWGSLRGLARCASRGRNVPDCFGNDVGFRLLSPGIFLDSGC